MPTISVLRRLTIGLLSGLALASCESKKTDMPPPASAQVEMPDPQTVAAKAWLEALYAHYIDGSQMTFSVLGDQAMQYFDPEMLDLMEAEKNVTPADEVGVLDGDPICDCQDFGSLKAEISAQPSGPSSVRATVILQETSKDFTEGTPPRAPAPKTLTYDLVLIKDQWRIHDITFAQGGSLRTMFQSAGKAMEKPKT